MTAGPVLRTILAFALPLTVADVLQQGYLLVDSAVVGRYVGVDGLAAVGAAQPLFYLANAMFIGLATAFTIRFAHLKGGGQSQSAPDVVRALVLFCLAWTVVAVLLATLAAEPLLRLMGLHGVVLGHSVHFLRVLALAFPGLFGAGAVSAYLRGLGHSRAAMRLQALGSVTNLLLAWLLVGPARMGVGGAALATACGGTLSLVVGVVHTARRYPVGGRPTREGARSELRGAVRLGFPIAIQHNVLAVGIMALVWVVAPLGPSVLAAFTVVGRLELFASLFFLDLSAALTTFVAQNLGAGRDLRVQRGLSSAVGLTVGLTVVLSAVLVLERTGVASLFTRDAHTAALTADYIAITYPFFVLYTVMVVIHGCFNGAGRTVLPLICTVLAFVLVQLPCAYLFRGAFGVDGVIWSVVPSWSVGLVFTAASARTFFLARPAGT